MYKIGGFRSEKSSPKFTNKHTKAFDVEKLSLLGAEGDHDIPEFTKVSNQGGLSACVTNAIADTVEICVGLTDPSKVVQVSRLQLYWNSRALHGATNIDGGTCIWMGLGQSRDVGICPETLWPYIEANVNVAPPLEATMHASDNKIKDFYRIWASGDEMVQAYAAAIRRDCPVVFGTQIGQSFQGILDGRPVTPPEKGDVILGGHAMVAVGVASYAGRLRFRIRNSWSESWGVDGYCWMDQDYISWDKTEDSHVVTHANPFI
jgi:C1A family cysteine protease